MNKDMNFEFELKQRFTDEAPELPEKLGKENIMKMLENDNYVPKKKKHLFLKGLSVAAALVIVAVSALVVPVILPEKALVEAETSTTVPETVQQVKYDIIDNGFKATKLLKAESSDDLRNHFIKVYKENMLDDMIDGAFGFYNKAADMAAPEGEFELNESMVETTAAAAQNVLTGAADDDVKYEAPAAGTTADDEYEVYYDSLEDSAEESYGKTNTQVENVDEADIIKNDGKYLYILSGGVYQVDRRITIVNAADMTVASTIEIEGEDSYFNIQEMYVNGDRLVVLATKTEKIKEEAEIYTGALVYDTMYGYGYYYAGDSEVVSFVYDISDREKPTLIREVSQDGYEYVSSRMIDGVLYTVSNYRVRGDSEEEIKKNAIPSVNGKEITCDCVYIYDYDSDNYVILTVYDTKLDDGEVTSVSVLGSGREVYCSKDALYVATGNHDYDNGNYTEIYSFSIDGTKVAYKASGTVKGIFLNQFSFDEYEGNLRVATTYYSYKHDTDVSNIYVLNKDLQLIGALEDLAYDEQVKSVRFMGAVGYVVTFRNTDPLFTLDLSDPTAPKVIGEVKLPGFSSYLHPVADGLVVGLGYDGDEESADWSSLKVSLFDVSDLKNPKEVDNFVLKDVYSQALDNPKAFISYPEEKLIGFPVEHYDTGVVLSYKLLKIENGEISSHLGFVHSTEKFIGDVFRGTYIGQKLYTIDNYNVCEFDIATAELLRKCEILNKEDDEPDYEEYGYDYYDDYEITVPAVEMTSEGYNPDAVATTTAAVTASDFDYDSITFTTTEKIDLYFTAKVAEVYDGGGFLVKVTDRGNSLMTVDTEATLSGVLYDGTTVSVKAGDSIKITFDGTVQETYPCKIPTVYSVEVV